MGLVSWGLGGWKLVSWGLAGWKFVSWWLAGWKLVSWGLAGFELGVVELELELGLGLGLGPFPSWPKFKIRSISAISAAVSMCPNRRIRIFPAMGPYL